MHLECRCGLVCQGSLGVRFYQRHSFYAGIEHNQYNRLLSSYPSMESVYGLRHHFPGYEVSFLVAAPLLNGDLAGYDVGCVGHRMGVPFELRMRRDCDPRLASTAASRRQSAYGCGAGRHLGGDVAKDVTGRHVRFRVTRPGSGLRARQIAPDTETAIHGPRLGIRLAVR